jgi:hypothetical protein
VAQDGKKYMYFLISIPTVTNQSYTHILIGHYNVDSGHEHLQYMHIHVNSHQRTKQGHCTLRASNSLIYVGTEKSINVVFREIY